MEFKVAVDKLQYVFSKLASIVKISDTGVAGMVMVQADKDLEFTASNGKENLIIDSIEAEIIQTGKIVFRFSDIKKYIVKYNSLVDGCGTEKFHFIKKDGGMVIKSKTIFNNSKPSYRKFEFQLFNKDAQSFPKIPLFDNSQFIINSSILKKGISTVLHCINPSEVRTAMQGLYIKITQNKIVFVGTNGIKLTKYSIPLETEGNGSYILTYSFVTLMKTILDNDAQVFIKFDDNQIFVKSNGMYIVGGLMINEEYPDYNALLNFENTIKMDNAGFYDIIHSQSDLLNDVDNNRLAVKFAGNKLCIKSDVFEATQDFDTPFDCELDVDFNGKFLDSMLSFFSGEIEVCFTNESNYVVFRSVENPEHNALLTVLKRH